MPEFLNDYYLAGAAAAFAHELMYWTNVLRRKQPVRPILLLMSLFYVIAGGVLAGLAAKQGGKFATIPMALGIGYLWNEFLKGLSGVAVAISKSAKILEEKVSGGGTPKIAGK